MSKQHTDTKGIFKFRKNDQIGAAAAEDDEFLSDCFVDTGDLALLEDPSDHRVIILGRTGSGKSALLLQLQQKHPSHAIEISPENLALTHVSNSNILKFFSDLGVNFDPFFKLLWRHVLTVEVLNRYFEQNPTNKSKNVLDHVRDMFSGNTRRDREMKEAIAYLETWGKTFWQQTEYRVKEITETVERNLEARMRSSIGTPMLTAEILAGGGLKLTEEVKAELRTRGQEVIATAQVQDLSRVLKLLNQVLSSRTAPYFLIIDN